MNFFLLLAQLFPISPSSGARGRSVREREKERERQGGEKRAWEEGEGMISSWNPPSSFPESSPVNSKRPRK